MKSVPFALAVLIGLPSLTAQEAAPAKWVVELPVPLVQATPAEEVPEPEPIEFDVLVSRTKNVHVSQAAEMADLPPVEGTIAMTIQKVANPNLPAPLLPLPPLAPDDPAVIARLQELKDSYKGTELVFISATVYDHHRSLVRIYPNGQTDNEVVAWSNLDFNHFSGKFGMYRVREPDGSFQDVGLLMGLGNEDIAKRRNFAARRGGNYEAPDIPELPDLEGGQPAFVIVSGEANSPAMATLEQLHDLYRTSGATLKADYLAFQQEVETRKAYLLANPSKPADVTVKVWKRTPAEIENTHQEEAR